MAVKNQNISNQKAGCHKNIVLTYAFEYAGFISDVRIYRRLFCAIYFYAQKYETLGDFHTLYQLRDI